MSSTISPSRIWTTREAIRARPMSWVIITMVWPAACSSSKRPTMALPEAESRLPVGSSARMIAGRFDEGAGDGHALHLAARQLGGLVVHAVGEVHALEHGLRPLAPLLGGDPAEEQGQLDVLERGRVGQQVEALEHEADVPVADLGEAVAVEPGRRSRRRARRSPGGRRVEAAEEVHERRLAGAGGPDDGHVLVAVDVEVDALEGLPPRRGPWCRPSGCPSSRSSSLVPQRHGGVDGRGAPRGEVAGEHADRAQDDARWRRRWRARRWAGP